jgi:uncharacterized protein DUF3536
MALARAISELTGGTRACVENFASVLARREPLEEVVLIEPSSWSCVHGVERWRSNCSCGLRADASHAWRRPLRAALNWLARQLDDRYIDRAEPFGDAWTLRDAYGPVAAARREDREAFVASLVGAANAADAVSILDGARARLGMFGSCAWFFDDVTGHETELTLRLAAFAIDSLAPGDDALESEFLERLAVARGDDPAGPSAATVYRERVVPLRAGRTS